MNPANQNPETAAAELSNLEVEQLLATVAAPAPAASAPLPESPVNGSAKRGIEPYDFRNPMLLAPREFRKLRIHQEEFVNALASRLSQYLRMEISLKLAGLQTIAYQKLAESWANPTQLTLFKIEPLRGISILEIPPRLALCMVDRLMGGPGKAQEPAPEVTEIERVLVEQVVQLVIGEWCGHWSRIKELKPVVLGHESNGRFVQTAPPETIMFVISLEMQLGQCAEKIQIGLPYVPLEPLIRQLSQGGDVAAQTATSSPVPAAVSWNTAFADICVPVAAEWQGLELTVREVLALKPGDVVRMDSSAAPQIVLRVAELPRFQGRPGVVAGQWAVELTQAIQNQTKSD